MPGVVGILRDQLRNVLELSFQLEGKDRLLKKRLGARGIIAESKVSCPLNDPQCPLSWHGHDEPDGTMVDYVVWMK